MFSKFDDETYLNSSSKNAFPDFQTNSDSLVDAEIMHLTERNRRSSSSNKTAVELPKTSNYLKSEIPQQGPQNINVSSSEKTDDVNDTSKNGRILYNGGNYIYFFPKEDEINFSSPKDKYLCLKRPSSNTESDANPYHPLIPCFKLDDIDDRNIALNSSIIKKKVHQDYYALDNILERHKIPESGK